jgi:hydrogenase large subunit
VYAGEPWYAGAQARFRALNGAAAGEVIPARAGLLHLMGLLAGKWPHTLGLQPGGSTRPILVQERLRLLAQLGEFRRFLERVTFAERLETLVGLDSVADLDAWRDAAAPDCGDLRHFLSIADALDLDRLGRASDRFMSYGAYPQQGRMLFAGGLWEQGIRSLDTAGICEDLSHSWMDGDSVHPGRGRTLPAPDKDGAYSWCKAPRLDGSVVEVGALARQLVDGHPLVCELVARSGGNVRNRVLARLLETARVVIAMEDWIRALVPGEPFCTDLPVPDEAEGVGLVEAARGSLGHWLSIREGRIANYQIIAPTTWNFSPRDADGRPGALEQALVGAALRDGERSPVSAQHIVRSFDPCMVCTVH